MLFNDMGWADKDICGSAGHRVSYLKTILSQSVSATALVAVLAWASTPSNAQSTCSTFTPSSGQTVTCTFAADANGDPVPITTPIIAPAATDVTVDIQDIPRPASDVSASMGGGTPTIDLGGGADITIINAELSNAVNQGSDTDLFTALFTQSGITSIEGLVQFLNDNGIPASRAIDEDGDEFIDIAPEDIPAATASLASILSPVSGAVVQVGTGTNTISLGTTDPELFSGEIIGLGADAIRFADGSENTINLGSGTILSLGANGSAVRVGAMSSLDFDGDDGYVNSGGDNSAAILVEGGGNAVDLQLRDTTISSFGAGSSAIRFHSDNSVINLEFSQPGVVISDPDNDAFFTTAGDDAPVLSLAGDASTVVLNFSGDPSQGVATAQSFGANSPFIVAALTNSSMTVTMDGGEVITEGANSAIIDAPVGAGSDGLFFFVGSTLTTRGDGSQIIRSGADDSSIVNVVVIDGTLSTEGAGATAIDFQGATQISSFTGFLGGNTTIATSGDDAPAILFNNGAQQTSNATLNINDVSITTAGARSAGFVAENAFANDASAADISIANTSIATQGAFAEAVSVNSSAFDNSAMSVTIGDDGPTGAVTLSTTGLGAAALHASFGSRTDSVASLSIENTTISTSGDIADGVVLASSVGTVVDTTAVTSGAIQSTTTATTGRLANALVIGENVTVVPFGSPLDSGAARIQIDMFSLDNFSSNGEGGRAILNNGTIEAGANGLTFGTNIIANIADNGLIAGTGAIAATFNDTDDIFELQPGSTTTGIVDAMGGTDTFVLGGVGSTTFDRARLGTQFLDFETFVKEDDSVWTLTNPNDLAWTITGGEFIVANNPLQTTETQFTLTTGITRRTDASTGLEAVASTFGTLTVASGVSVATAAPNAPAVQVIGRGVVNVLGSISTTGDNSAAIAGSALNSTLDMTVSGVSGGAPISTTGDNAAGIEVGMLPAGSELSVNLTNLSVQTSGDGSAGIRGGSVVNDGSTLSFDSANLTIQTSGTGADGLLVEGLVDSSVGDSLSRVTVSSAEITTTGDGSTGFQIGEESRTTSGQGMDQTFTVNNFTIGTEGEGSTGLAIFGNGDGATNANTNVVSRNVEVTTLGNDATGMTYSVFGSNGNGNNTNLLLAGQTVRTSGDRSNGIVVGDVASRNTNLTGTLTQVAFDDLDIMTGGDDAIGLVLDPFSASATDSVATVVGSNSVVATSGARAHGLVFGEGLGVNIAGARTAGLPSTLETAFADLEAGIGAGPFNVISQLTLSNLAISTSGVNANGVVIGANSTVPFHGTVSTTGDGGNGFVLDPAAALSLFGTVSTSGEFANGIVGGTGPAGTPEILLESGSSVSAAGAGSAAVYLAGGAGTASVTVKEGATASSTQGAVVGEDGSGIDTTLSVAGRIERSNAADDAVALGNGNDTLVIFPTAAIIGEVDLGAGFDVFATDGAVGTTGNLALLAGGVPFAVGVERIEKRGEGTWIFEGIDIPAGFTLAPGFVLDGTAVINVNARGLDLTNEIGGRVEGSGGVETFLNRGVFAPGGANAAGAFSVADTFTLAADGTLEVDIFADGSTDLVTVGGNTILGGRLLVNAVNYPTSFPDASSYTIITADSLDDTITGNFASVEDNLPDVDVTVGIEPAFEAMEVDEVDQNARVVVGYERGGAPSDKSIHPNAVQAASGAASEFSSLLVNRAAQSGVSNTHSPSPNSTALAYAKDKSTADNPAARELKAFSDDRFDGQGRFAWMSGYGSWRDVDGTGAATGYRSALGGVAVGMDTVFEHNGALVTFGAAGGYSMTGVKSGISSADIDTWQFGLYGSVKKDAFSLSGSATLGVQDYDYTRVIPVGPGFATAAGDASGTAFAGSLVAAYDIAPMLGLDENGMSFAPLVRFDHVSAHRKGFTETGAGILNLSVAADDFTRNYLSLGFMASARYVTGSGMVIRPTFEARWEHGFGDAQVLSNAIIAGVAGATFTSAGAFESRDRAVLGAGLDFDVTASSKLTIRYDGSFASGFQHHAARIGFTAKF